MARVTGRLALVVGGASGIGRACVDELLAAGWRVAVADLKPGDDLPSEVSVTPPLDVRRREAVDACIASVSADGDLGAVVFTAGTARVTPMTDIGEREWDLVMGVNLTGTFNVTRAAGAAISDGAIILLSSVDARSPVPGLAHYCAAKAGVEAVVRSAALELAPRGIRCNAVAPGVVRTPLMADPLADPQIERAFLDAIPLGRIADPADVASTIAFLVSPAAKWITGVTVTIDGGMHLKEHPDLLDLATRKGPS